jgi:hypothetical protein
MRPIPNPTDRNEKLSTSSVFESAAVTEDAMNWNSSSAGGVSSSEAAMADLRRTADGPSAAFRAIISTNRVPGLFVNSLPICRRDKGCPTAKLCKRCDVVIVDEGHYEPAAAWSLSIRGLGLPTILVTATPYRNDPKPFEFDETYVHVSRYSELLAEGFLRDVEPEQAPPQSARNPKDFVETVLDFFKAKYGEWPSEGRKLIVRCRSKEQIEQIGHFMRAHQAGTSGVLCLHEAFTNDPKCPWEKRQPSDPEAPGAPAIWVHQHKLLEGVDGPSFRALAFYGVLGSARALVQQIGRVIRNPQRERTEKALLIDHSGGFIADMWRRFREYDASIDETPLKLGLDDFAKTFEANLPPVVYADRQFRRRFGFNISVGDVRRSLRLPLRCHLYEVTQRKSMSKLAGATEERLVDGECPFQTIISSEDELLILFVKLGTSPLLAEDFFIERELHAFVARKAGPVMAILDTSRAGLESRARLQELSEFVRPARRIVAQRSGSWRQSNSPKAHQLLSGMNPQPIQSPELRGRVFPLSLQNLVAQVRVSLRNTTLPDNIRIPVSFHELHRVVPRTLQSRAVEIIYAS